MDRLAPEIMHMVVSLLELKDCLQFRLVNKKFAIIGSAYLLEEISMSIHSKHLAKMRGVAGQPLLARNVKSLIYETNCLNPDPETLKYYALRWGAWSQMASESLIPTAFDGKPNFSGDQLKESYQKYLDETRAQVSSWASHDDYRCLAQVLPSFCKLRKVIMSSGMHFNMHRRGMPTVYDDVAHIANYDHEPRGTRELEALLDALGLHEMYIAELEAGLMDWRFFDKEPERLEQLFEPLGCLLTIDLALTLVIDDGGALQDEAAKCRDLLKQGQVGNLLKSCPDLLVLSFGMQGDFVEFEPAASLDWVIPPGHVWGDLRSLELEGVDCSREAIWNVLELHKDKLTNFSFGEIDLDGSWYKLLPDIRHKLHLRDVFIYGRIAGRSEDTDRRPEYWSLEMPDTGESDMRSSISRYCELGGEHYPDELPLSPWIVHKYFNSHVRRPGVISEHDEEGESVGGFGFGDWDHEEQFEWRYDGRHEEEEEEEEEEEPDAPPEPYRTRSGRVVRQRILD